MYQENNYEESKSSKKLIVAIIIILLFISSGTYAYLVFQGIDNTTATQVGCFEVNYSAQEINASELVSTTNYLEGAHTTVSLSKNANCPIYTQASIYAHTNDTTTAPINTIQALKYKVLLSGETIKEGVITNISNNDTKLATVELTTDIKNYDIYIWIDSDISGGAYNQTTYSGYIYAESIQSSTIPNQITTINLTGNAPNLDNDNLIPVYYDETEEVWKKADSSNSNYSWYNYEEKRWANAVMISDNAKRSMYKDATVNTIIVETDISGFLVWIPRFKYRVWNIARQAGIEGDYQSNYAYSAYTDGIDIEWEIGTNSTGNVECTYNTATHEGSGLSDVCVYKGTDTITKDSINSEYADAWYTHPAFTFGGEEKLGFWIGKFETTGTITKPTVLPDQLTLLDQTVSQFFTTSKVFQTYGISSNLDAHMLTNLEWAAVAYLTHSNYGLCGENFEYCRDVFHNNSSAVYTGRSSGGYYLQLKDIYPDDTTSTETYNSTGYYTYKGYFIDYNGNITATKEISKIASTTRNVTGVYDLSGGGYEYVMANMVDSSNLFFPLNAGTNWNGNSVLDAKYYNAYSYGTGNSDKIAYYRSRLGDATAEVLLYDSEHGYYSWQEKWYHTGNATILSSEKPWLFRGCSYKAFSYGKFCFGYGTGIGIDQSGAFRLAIS